ncbi:MAG: sulfite exporter TauE/SafE family protein [Amycolatopsis sp.]|jgi:uncharacterized membrane protein YfcA|nr:sulfite exporter TauE/SafE family protein [Amycolatopsis sp.]
MGPGVLLLLVLAGVGAGLTGSVAGLASLVSYPALLAAGLPPLAANMTNTVAMMGTTVGAAAGSRPELSGQRGRLLRLSVITMIGGAVGGVLLLVTPPGAFTAVVPWLIAGASILLMVGQRLRAAGERGDAAGLSPAAGLAAFGVAIYGGYFGAAAGVLMLALLSTVWTQSLARTNAAKNIATGVANLVAAIVFACTGKVYWPAAVALCAGSILGSWVGPLIVRRLPAGPLRIVIGIAGLGLAVVLGWKAFS